jgi:sugar O-acyltransferase (sialic acid O-acetyltransferase NeuD family)
MMDLYIYGSGGTGCELVDIARRINRARSKWHTIHFVDDIRTEREHYQTRVFRFEQMLAETNDYECIIAQGEPDHRRALHERLCAHSVKLATVIDETATISLSAVIGRGCIIGPNSFVSSHTHLEENVMLEVHTIVGHDIVVGKHSVVSSCTVIGGRTHIGDESFIGMNCTIKDRLQIGSHCIVGMHSGVFSDIDDGMIALGNPARVVRRNEDRRVFKG